MKIDFNTLKEKMNSNTPATTSLQASNGPRVGFFSLKNDKDQAIVRFMVNSIEDVEIIAGHRTNVGGKLRFVSCLREPKEDVDKCPLCASGDKVQYRVYIKLLEYTRNDQGKIVAIPRIWERSTSYVNTINNMLNEYGPLSDNIFKITRNGAAGSTTTTYDIVYGLPTVYKPEIYPKNDNAFEGYKVLGSAVIDLDYNKMSNMVGGNVEEATPQPTPQPTYNKSEPMRENNSYAPEVPKSEGDIQRPKRFY